MPRLVLVINVGSSSVKYELLDMEVRRSVLQGEAEQVGTDGREHALESAFDAVAAAGVTGASDGLWAVAHRVVHGGAEFTAPVVADDGVLERLEALDAFAPLHNPGNRLGIRAARRRFPDVPHIAVFDTAFHGTIPPHAYRYAVPREWHSAHGVRRYGFHGPSHAYVSRMAAEHLGVPLESTALITLHLGNGASAAAILGGRSIDTSMGMTPLEGLVMGTRCGDVDPALPSVMRRLASISAEGVDEALYERSGLLGMCGASDMREVHAAANGGDAEARIALEVFCYRIRKYVGAYYAVLGRLDALVFTGGIGENDAEVRARVCERMEHLGIVLDPRRNSAQADGTRNVAAVGSRAAVLVVPTDEELEMATEALECLERTRIEGVLA